MYLKKSLLLFSFILFSLGLSLAGEPALSYKLYGFVRNDIYFNSRTNEQALDGLFNILPKPIELNTAGEDKNAVPNSEMLSVASRLGLDFSGTSFLGAKSSAKIECDFAGISTNYYLIRLRQAYLKLNWSNTELLVGQTWHPLFGSVLPTVPALSTGSPFQPFNRSPQIRLRQTLTEQFSVIAAAAYQMQYMTQGPNGTSASYMKNALQPDFYLGVESKNAQWLSGLAVSTKAIKINHQLLRSSSASVYSQFIDKKIQIKAKAMLGQNMSDYLMPGGIGVGIKDAEHNEDTYTNFNSFSSWFNLVYGTKLQVGLFAGFSQNLGTENELSLGTDSKYNAFGYGFYQNSQQLLNSLYRISPSICYQYSNIKLGLEYENTQAEYGQIKKDGNISSPGNVSNHRVMATISYHF